jgi:hypothetical protein
VSPRTFVTGEFGKAVAEVRLPLTKAGRIQDFTVGLVPFRKRPRKD